MCIPDKPRRPGATPPYKTDILPGTLDGPKGPRSVRDQVGLNMRPAIFIVSTTRIQINWDGEIKYVGERASRGEGKERESRLIFQGQVDHPRVNSNESRYEREGGTIAGQGRRRACIQGYADSQSYQF